MDIFPFSHESLISALTVVYLFHNMFCCCGDYEGGDDALEMYQTPHNQSQISMQGGAKLKSHAPMRGRVISNISKQGKQPKLKSVMNYATTQASDLADYALKKIRKSNYERLKEQYGHTNNQWTDPDFPPEQRSFGLGRDSQRVTWKRIHEFIDNPVFMDHSMSPHDIMQGGVGDCYFLSAIAGLAEREARIKNIFGDLTISKNGIYMGRVFHGGVYKEIVVDDYFPISKKTGRPAAAQPADGDEVWVMILEKMWAKLFGSYENIDGGLPNEVLHAFSGAPIFQYLTNVSNQDNDELFYNMLESAKLEETICCGTNSQAHVEDMGLVEGHAYTILDVYDKPCRLLKVRNPWGSREWAGPACDQDTGFWSQVSAADKRRLGHKDKDDGIFFIVWEDFLQYFQLVNICKVNDKASYYYEELTFPKGRGIFTNVTCSGGETTIALTQELTRGVDVPQPRYATSSMVIARQKETGAGEDYEYVSSLTERNTCDSNLELPELKEGQYMVFSTLTGRKMKEDATLSCYSETPCQMDPITSIKEEDFLHRVFLDHARKNKQNQQGIFGPIDVWVCMDIVYDSGFAYTVIHVGESVNMKLSLHFNEDQYEDNNFELLPPFRGTGDFNIVCEKGEDSIVLAKIIPSNYAIEASLPIPNIKRLR